MRGLGIVEHGNQGLLGEGLGIEVGQLGAAMFRERKESISTCADKNSTLR